MTTATQPHRTRGYQPTALADITIRIHPTPDIDSEVWLALHTDVDAAIDRTLEKRGLAAVRNGH